MSHTLHICVKVTRKREINCANMLVNKSINIRSINNIDLPIILYKPDRNVLQIIDKWWPNCKNMLILQLVYPRVQKWWSTALFCDMVIKQISDKNILPTCWHSLSPASFFFWFSEVKLQYSFSYFVVLQYLKNWWNLQQYFFIINCFIVVYWEIEIYITPTFARTWSYWYNPTTVSWVEM